MAHKILIIEEDDALRALLAEELSSSPEFTAQAKASRAAGQAAAAEADLLILAAGADAGECGAFIERLRGSGFRAPIILINNSERGAEALLGRLSSGGQGANDYVTKPFRIAVLLARIKAQLQHHQRSEDAAFAIGPYILKPGQKLLIDKAREKIRLTEKEAAILKYLYQAGEEPVERERLLEEVWGYNSGVTTHTLETHIYRLRQKIEKDPANAEILLTVPGGYRLAR